MALALLDFHYCHLYHIAIKIPLDDIFHIFKEKTLNLFRSFPHVVPIIEPVVPILQAQEANSTIFCGSHLSSSMVKNLCYS